MTKKKENFLIFICWAAYTSAYVGRLNYNASMVEILSQLGTTKEVAGVVSSCFFFAYGAGQLINGILSKKYNTKYSVTAALGISAVINICMTLCSSVSVMKYLWFANGIFQSILWSSLIKTLSVRLKNESLSKAVMVMSTTVATGTFAAYGLSSMFSFLKVKWTCIFIVASAVLAITAILWFFGMCSIEKSPVTTNNSSSISSKSKLNFTPVFIVSLVALLSAAVSDGFIKDGVTTWIPSILKEEFGVSSSLSIIVTLLLPILSIFGAVLVKLLHKKIKNTTILNAVFYIASTALIMVIILSFSMKNTVVTLLIFGLIACLMSAVNNVITSIIPLYARDKIDSGLAAGVLNTFCYVGSTLSIPLLGHLADTKGWTSVFITILIFSSASFLICTIAGIITKKSTAA